MTDQEFAKVLQNVNKQLEKVAEKLNSIGQPAGPWTKWYAWYPVYTVSNQRIWLKQIYRRKERSLITNLADWEYATDFDLLKDGN